MKSTVKPALVALVGAAFLLAARPALAEIEWGWGAFVENDLRVAVDRVDEPGINRNETALGVDLRVDLMPDRLRFVGNLKFAWVGFTRDTEFEGLTTRNTVSPYYLESDAAYIEVIGILPDLDLRVGRQIVSWGAADMFNPTSNLNALDLEDPIKFGELVANEMIKLDWNPGGGDFILSAVWVPVFQPANLPGSALLAVGDPESMFPFVSPATRLQAERIRNIYLRNPDYYNILQPEVTATMPELTLDNTQVGARVQFLVGMFDMSLSYYRGIDTIPVPLKSYSTATRSGEAAPDGTPILDVATDVRLVYPRKQVVGFDLAGQLPFLDDAGFWVEGALFFPEEVEMEFDIREVAPGAEVITDDTVSSRPFFKYTIGADYTINQHLFVTGQFIHGFVDEFGYNNIHDYWLINGDIKMLQERLMVRLSVIGEIPHDDDDIPLDEDGDGRVESFAPGATDDGKIGALALVPGITARPIDGLELTLGAYFLLGHEESKFGQPAAGPSLAYFRARASF
jgi:hypothetical protein